ncbi:nucleoside hydrolase [Nonomuraea sp. MG754425]|uniref:nucleoside hydrolase n=1 Tax=Nonomuraea sp. MG754425 TaxID=2570319 RepID=UPI001F3FCB53|nr:nucleoside hydrolase [Nonomuraea sp. MG754425]MCF6469659.1 nucleoside hydrolase [Nonomuraea sp. MG754425]
MSTPRKIILDTDPGVGIRGTDADDPIALMLALADPRLELLGVTTVFGNCPPALGARGAAAVLAAAGRSDVPVAVGMRTRLDGTLPGVLAEAYQGARGEPGTIELPDLATAAVREHAVDFLVDTVLTHPGEVTVVAIGPQTNLAMAMLKEPEVAAKLRSVVFMGGALGLESRYGRGNVTSVAECNIWYDPRAADIVFRSGVDLTMISLDVTNPATGLVLSEETIRGIDRGASRIAPMLADVCATYLDAPMFEWADGCVLYDPLAVAVAADPDVASFADMAVGVETAGELTAGQTVPLRGQDPNVHVCVGVDGPQVVDDILRTILTI